MSELTLLLLRIGFLVLMWFFVFAVVYSLRADLFGVKVRRMPQTAEASGGGGGAAPVAAASPPVSAPRRGEPATLTSAKRLVITSGPKAGLELPLGADPLTIGRSSESGLVIRDDYTSSHHARLMPWEQKWMLQDLDSTNGTFLDGNRVTSPVQVSLGSSIKVGATTFELRA
ncbi:FHA domain-containing protein FhaB/FipA [Microbacterium sp. YY-01]|uniref:FHA domain-containing protein FhaB/FipA n=1 Tax=Microbacterium sp. YY-01 TaxID=3421634 RepID=UPI003D1645F6